MPQTVGQHDPLGIFRNREVDVPLEDLGRALVREAKEDVPQALRVTSSTLLREVFRGLVETTPVLTGRARRNWKPSVGAPDTEVVYPQPEVPIDPAPVTGYPMTPEESARVTAAVAALRVAEPGTPAYITNSVPYIGKLDQGWSAKAPAGIVDVAIMRAIVGLEQDD